jgi:Sec-independent protein translocase protein TatA
MLFIVMSLGLQMFFGAKKLPELAKALRQSIVEFKKAAKGRNNLPPSPPGSPPFI